MLVLSRKQDEEILISGGIRIRVVRVSGNRVQLGIVAGDDIRIQRAELLHSGAVLAAGSELAMANVG